MLHSLIPGQLSVSQALKASYDGVEGPVWKHKPVTPPKNDAASRRAATLQSKKFRAMEVLGEVGGWKVVRPEGYDGRIWFMHPDVLHKYYTDPRKA